MIVRNFGTLRVATQIKLFAEQINLKIAHNLQSVFCIFDNATFKNEFRKYLSKKTL
jgi:hypothetical protein